MTTLPQIVSPFTLINALNGLGLNGGSVYIGVANQDPQTNPQAVYWDAGMTIPATQPLSVVGGYICRTGTPAAAYTADAFSIRTLDSNGDLVFYAASVEPQIDQSLLLYSGGPLGTPLSGDLSNCSSYPPTILQVSKSTSYTLILSDAGKQIIHPASDANARTFTIPSNASVAFPIGTPVTFINMTANVVTIAIDSDTLYLAGTGSTGSRTLARYGMVTALKIVATVWLIGGSGIS